MECDGCTLCCLILPVPSIDKYPGIWCEHCKIGVGCKIWNNKPKECETFKCAYNQVDNISTDLRPDKCKIIFEKLNDNVFFGTMHPKYNEAYKKRIVRGQIMDFLKQGFSVIISSFTLNKPMIFPAKGKVAQEIWLDYKEQIYDRTFIYN